MSRTMQFRLRTLVIVAPIVVGVICLAIALCMAGADTRLLSFPVAGRPWGGGRDRSIAAARHVAMGGVNGSGARSRLRTGRLRSRRGRYAVGALREIHRLDNLGISYSASLQFPQRPFAPCRGFQDGDHRENAEHEQDNHRGAEQIDLVQE
jgi:hypothetical protein